MAPSNITPSEKRAVFMSKDMTHRIVRVPQSERLGVTADQVIENWPGLVYQFEDGYLVIDDHRREEDRRYFDAYGEKLGLERRKDGGWDDFAGRYRPDEPAEVWLRKHAHAEVEGGFVEVTFTSTDSGPPILELISDAVLAEDTDRLLRLYQAEEAGEQRQDVLDRIKAAIETLDARKEQRERELVAAQGGAAS